MLPDTVENVTTQIPENTNTYPVTFVRNTIVFNLENISYFPSCSGGPISLHHSFTPSLPVRHLEIGGRGGGGERSFHMKRQGMPVGKFEFNSGRLMWTLPELHYTHKRCHLKRNRFHY